MEEESIMDDEQYSNPYENFCRLKRTVTFLQNNGRVTEDWLEEHKNHILKYNEMFPNFSQTNLEITDTEFRKIAAESEVLLRNLVRSIYSSQGFNLKFYLMLNEHMIKMCEFIFTQDELDFCMSKLSI